ncbi:MAG: MerR family transcriptional regulator [Deltaproteobacteria bacterium]|jgi:DNA-binding transcriptional MerR regulator|nr:MerR family transcriptional regulator [Deltaproteobacteria bacterium]
MVRPGEPLYFKIGEAAVRVGVERHVLRYWSKEFPQIQPSLLKGRHRLYSSLDLRYFQEIKRLLYEERFTIEGARKRLEEKPLAPLELKDGPKVATPADNPPLIPASSDDSLAETQAKADPKAPAAPPELAVPLANVAALSFSESSPQGESLAPAASLTAFGSKRVEPILLREIHQELLALKRLLTRPGVFRETEIDHGGPLDREP